LWQDSGECQGLGQIGSRTSSGGNSSSGLGFALRAFLHFQVCLEMQEIQDWTRRWGLFFPQVCEQPGKAQ